MTHILNNWKPYLSEEDFEYLINYVENCKYNMRNNKLLVLLGNGGANGKSTLIREIVNYLDNKNYMICDTYGSAFLEPIVKLIHIPAIDAYKKKYIQQLKNIIQYGQSIVAETNEFDKIPKPLLKYIRIMEMEYKFL
jgi:tRNA A37 threonylcarbamoyladenosine biosynthesis protein TsaE